MIGPHEGKELKLMLKGEKSLSLFYDVVSEEGGTCEDIIPEKEFSSYVDNGTFLRFSQDIFDPKNDYFIRYVLFTLPNEAWRAEFVLWLKSERFAGRLGHDPAHDQLIGQLLGYQEQDIEDFLCGRRQDTTAFIQRAQVPKGHKSRG